jgi:hypothetical protein
MEKIDLSNAIELSSPYPYTLVNGGQQDNLYIISIE